jgi:hypothetical protein
VTIGVGRYCLVFRLAGPPGSATMPARPVKPA